MSTTLINSVVALSKDLGDYYAGTATSSGNTGGTTLVDTSLMSKNDDWLDSTASEMWDLITSGTYDEEERRIDSLESASGVLTVTAHGGQIASAVTYQIHRMWSASEKRIALIDAAKDAYPYIFDKVFDETKITGNWLKDGSFEIWTSATALTNWTTDTSTVGQTATVLYYKHGTYSCKIDTAAGNIKQSISNNTDLQALSGKTVKFSIQAWCDTASCLRIGIYDGTDHTYSDYHDGGDAWTENNEPLEVTATICENPTVIEFYVYHAIAAGSSYVDDARVICGTYNKVYIGDLGLARDRPHKVSIFKPYTYDEQPVMCRKWMVDNGWLYISYPSNYNLRIEGIAYLDFLASSVASTDWAATIDIDSPQLKILTAMAAVYLFRQRAMPTMTSGDQTESQTALAYWERELESRISKFAMYPPPTTRLYSGDF